jgi:dihydroorotase
MGPRSSGRRGIRFDLDQGEGNFIFRNAVPALRVGFYPDSISTDFHGLSMNSGLVDLPNTMSNLIAINMPLPEVARGSG